MVRFDQRCTLAVLVFVMAVALMLTVIEQHPIWTPDGFLYAQTMLVDTGMDAARARSEAQAFYLAQPVGKDPRYRPFFGAHPGVTLTSLIPLFAPRVVYPFLAAQLYRWRGFAALSDVSALSYVVSAVGLYWLLLCFGRPLFAAFGALGLLFSPAVVWIARSALTDMTAMMFWILTLATFCYYAKTRAWWWMVVYALACVLLAFTRPITYLAFGAVSAYLVACWLRREYDRLAGAAALAVIAVAASLLYMQLSAALHAPGLAFMLEWPHRRAIELGAAQPKEPLRAWYFRTILNMLRGEATHAVRTFLPLLSLVGAIVQRQTMLVPALFGVALFSSVAILINPIPGDLSRTVEIPLFPIIAAGVISALEAFLYPDRRFSGAI